MIRLSSLAMLAFLLPSAVATGQSHDQTDTAFAHLQQRGQDYMGVDQYTSTHRFEDLANGGRIVLVRDSTDTAGVAMIRMHLQHIAGAFGQGDFKIPMLVHEKDVPGIDVMARKAQAIHYDFSPLPGGGQVTISTSDAEAVAAVHRFLAFQRKDHRTEEPHDHAGHTPS